MFVCLLKLLNKKRTGYNYFVLDTEDGKIECVTSNYLDGVLKSGIKVAGVRVVNNAIAVDCPTLEEQSNYIDLVAIVDDCNREYYSYYIAYMIALEYKGIPKLRFFSYNMRYKSFSYLREEEIENSKIRDIYKQKEKSGNEVMKVVCHDIKRGKDFYITIDCNLDPDGVDIYIHPYRKSTNPPPKLCLW